jgi:predicted NAD/FAD-binding protein
VFVKPLDTGTIKCAYVNQTLYANLTMLMRYIGYNTGLKSMANKIGEPNCIRLSDTQYLYYVNAAGAAQLMAMSNMTVSAQKYRAVFAELYRVNSEGKDLSSFDYYFTFEQMLEIMFAINQSPIKKAYVASLLSAGRTGGAL